MKTQRHKIAIVGAGNVGATFAFALIKSGLAREIVLIDKDIKHAEGECMDLNHGAAFVSPVKIYAADYKGCKDADIIVITAGARQKSGETRLDLLQRNVEIFKDIIKNILHHTKDAILLVVTNPVDILSYVSMKLSGLPKERVFGSGTVLDSSRFRYLLSDHCHVDPRNVHAEIIGEHGDTELAVWSQANIGGMKLNAFCSLCARKDCNSTIELHKIFEEVKNSAYKIIEAKGATCYAIALSLVKIVESILRDENSILPVSSYLKDYYGIKDVYLSVPSLVNRNGVEKVLKLELSKQELKSLRFSAEQLKSIIKKIKL